MSQKITYLVDGKLYTSLEDMPPEVREKVKNIAPDLAEKANKEGLHLDKGTHFVTSLYPVGGTEIKAVKWVSYFIFQFLSAFENQALRFAGFLYFREEINGWLSFLIGLIVGHIGYVFAKKRYEKEQKKNSVVYQKGLEFLKDFEINSLGAGVSFILNIFLLAIFYLLTYLL